ncbi:MAG: DUF3305 domain-containing protein [Paracoccaceae bacterium]
MTRPENSTKSITMPVGVILRRSPGTTRWAKWLWAATGLLPGAGPGNWQVLQSDGGTTEFLAATVPMTLYRTDTEAYLTSLNGKPPSVFVILRPVPGRADARPEVLTVTASAYEAQDYADNGEDIVERVPMPEGLQAWVGQFVQEHHADEVFIKRKRRDYMANQSEDGIGDARVRQTADVFRSPGALRDQNK